MNDTDQLPTKQQRKLFIGLLERLSTLCGDVQRIEWEEEIGILRKKTLRVLDELDKVYVQMYPLEPITVTAEGISIAEIQQIFSGMPPIKTSEGAEALRLFEERTALKVEPQR